MILAKLYWEQINLESSITRVENFNVQKMADVLSSNLPHLDEQEKIVTKIEVIEVKIEKCKSDLETLKQQKLLTIKNHLLEQNISITISRKK